ncbi:protein-L-isoaspartate O-methyltransferase [Sphingomonas sp. BN140010]|uniref:Protein-L-isoaspartate O-methyltransferase n=1 Tax=Sphingomonas arvum TaxID=2992113 RepID=A0ABT3JCH4_9SPHN|nr:protein-L-isoaspartate O-methyltransferase [Sphingomonas sp. BN140010]MCW3796768.1 protein-L-isoaspartate O-methyltransferase [Sphingomonas sp. BN140010]
MDYAKARRVMVDSQLRPQAVTDPLVVAAMAAVPREQFVPEAVQPVAYMDRILDLGGGKALSPPATLGRMLTELGPRSGERALVVGTAPAYAAAVLAAMGVDVVTLSEGDLAQGLAGGGPYDVIILDGAVEVIPDTIIAQLREGGRLGTCLIENGVQRLVIGRRAGAFGTKSIADAAAARLPGFDRPRAFVF